LMRDLGVFPQTDAQPAERERQEQMLLRLDEFERGYPRLKLSFVLDVVGQCKATVNKTSFQPYNDVLKGDAGQEALERLLDRREMPPNAASWGKLHSVLWRLHRLRVFDRQDNGGRILNYRDLTRPGHLTVMDLSDAGTSELSSLAVADVLRGIQEEQERAYRRFENGESGAEAPPRVLVVIEEAHEFFGGGAERLRQAEHLYEQVARLAKRGRKRWIGLVFVTQLPQHLPRQVLGLVNSFVLHKISDPMVVQALRKTVPGIDETLWNKLPGLAPGQAIVSFPHMARPLLVSVDPA